LLGDLHHPFFASNWVIFAPSTKKSFMQKILVTTDFSIHSKAGMRFAIQLAAQKKVELVFFHCFQALIPTTVFRERIEKSLENQGDTFLKKLKKLVEGVYKSVNITPGNYRTVVIDDLNPEVMILDYAEKNSFSFICMSTRGAGQLRKIMGTNTSNIILKSAVPVLAIPHTYRIHPIKKILYASDLENLDQQMQVISPLAESLGAKVDLANFFNQVSMKLDAGTLSEMWQKKYPELDNVIMQQLDTTSGFAAQLDVLSKKLKPDMVVFFRNVNKTWFDKVFSVSRSETFSFISKVPMLVYRKSS